MKHKLTLVSAKICCRLAPVLALGMFGTAMAHFFLGVGNYPDQSARNAVGGLFLCLFFPVVLAIWVMARQRVKQLTAAVRETNASNAE
jgi:hypothetical protein